MASTRKSAGLMVMLMLAALAVSAQADDRKVTCKNDLPKPIKCNGHDVPAHGEALVPVNALGDLIFVIVDVKGVPLTRKCRVPYGVTAILVYVDVAGILRVKIFAVLGGLLGGLLGLVGQLLCVLTGIIL